MKTKYPTPQREIIAQGRQDLFKEEVKDKKSDSQDSIRCSSESYGVCPFAYRGCQGSQNSNIFYTVCLDSRFFPFCSTIEMQEVQILGAKQ